MFRPADNPARHPAPAAAGVRPSSQLIVFCVDDEAEDRRLFERLLQEPGLDYPSMMFAGGEEMLEALLAVLRGAAPPLACFIDLKMAGMSGLDVLRWIRCQRALDAVPVIMLSSSDDPEKLLEARNSGAQCYVAKFPTAAQLRDVLLEAERYSAAHAVSGAFQLPCNLLLNSKTTGPSLSGGTDPFSIRIAGAM